MWSSSCPTTPGASAASPMAPMIPPAASPARARAALPGRRSCRSRARPSQWPGLRSIPGADDQRGSHRSDPTNTQGWNRYSYVGNDPLAFTDPNGYSWLSSFFHSVTSFFASNPIARAIVDCRRGNHLWCSGAWRRFRIRWFIVGRGRDIRSSGGGKRGHCDGAQRRKYRPSIEGRAIAGATALAFFEVGSYTPGAWTPRPIRRHMPKMSLVTRWSDVVHPSLPAGLADRARSRPAFSAAAGPLINYLIRSNRLSATR